MRSGAVLGGAGSLYCGQGRLPPAGVPPSASTVMGATPTLLFAVPTRETWPLAPRAGLGSEVMTKLEICPPTCLSPAHSVTSPAFTVQGWGGEWRVRGKMGDCERVGDQEEEEE